MNPIKSLFLLSTLVIIFGMLGCSTQNNNPSPPSPQPKKPKEVQTSTDTQDQTVIIPKPRVPVSNLPIPKGFVLYQKVEGDLNGDQVVDTILIIKDTKEENVVENRFDETVDRNRRGLMIYFGKDNQQILVTKNLDCFSSENEDGGIYFPPELYFDIKDQKLYIHYGHGRYGFWRYTFRFDGQNDFDLIGYDASNNFGPIVNEEVSINFLTKKKLIRENINADAEPNEEVFKETWENIELKELIKLSEIEDFDELRVE